MLDEEALRRNSNSPLELLALEEVHDEGQAGKADWSRKQSRSFSQKSSFSRILPSRVATTTRASALPSPSVRTAD